MAQAAPLDLSEILSSLAKKAQSQATLLAEEVTAIVKVGPPGTTGGKGHKPPSWPRPEEVTTVIGWQVGDAPNVG